VLGISPRHAKPVVRSRFSDKSLSRGHGDTSGPPTRPHPLSKTQPATLARRQKNSRSFVSSSNRIYRPARRSRNSGIRPSTFYRRYDRFRTGGPESLTDKPSKPDRVCYRIPDAVRERVVAMALEIPDCPRANWRLASPTLNAPILTSDSFIAASLMASISASSRGLAFTRIINFMPALWLGTRKQSSGRVRLACS
jgi:hypothetical protein